MEQIKNQKTWNFHIGTQKNTIVPIWLHIGSQQQDRQNSKNLNNDTFCRLPVTCVQ